MRDPWFWSENTLSSQFVRGLLGPVSFVYQTGSKLKSAYIKPDNFDDCAVFCIGNATVGGVGKTPFAIMLKNIFDQHAVPAAFLSRGYGGREIGPLRVDLEKHTARDVGDEALILARHAPVWIAKDRAQGLREARKAGFFCLIADDGFQNPALQKDLSILMVGSRTVRANEVRSDDIPDTNSENSSQEEDGDNKSGSKQKNYTNRNLFPVGPFREPMQKALERADLVCFVRHQSNHTKLSPKIEKQLDDKPYGIVWVEAPPEQNIPSGPVFAFCGIGNPERFRKTLVEAGVDVGKFVAYPDHHVFTEAELNVMRFEARQFSQQLITTQKDFARLDPDQQDQVDEFKIVMRTDAQSLIWQMVEEVLIRKNILPRENKNIIQKQGVPG